MSFFRNMRTRWPFFGIGVFSSEHIGIPSPRKLRIELLENRLQLSATATMMGQEIDLPTWLSPDEVATVQGLVAEITTAASNAPAFPATNFSYPLIGVTDYLSNQNSGRFDGSGYSIAILDTGITWNHPAFGPDLNPPDGIGDRIVYQYDFADDDTFAHDLDIWAGHGTHVAGIAAGAAPGVDLIMLKVFPDNPEDGGVFPAVEEALQWVVAHAALYNIAAVNMSIVDSQNYDTNMALYGIDDELAAVAGMDIGIAVSAGNKYGEFQQVGVAYPAADASVISVGATWAKSFPGPQNILGAINNTTAPDHIAAFSQRHADLVHVFAPGARIVNAGHLFPTNEKSGTSMAAPHVAAAIALAQQISEYVSGTRLTKDDLIELFQETGVTIIDGDDEVTNVPNTGLTFARLDVMAMANRLLPPSVMNVILKETDGTATEYHFNTVDGDGRQLMTVPVGDPTIVQVQFSEPVTVAKNDLRLVGVLRGHAPDVVSSTLTPPDATNDFTATWEFVTPLVPANRKGDYYLLSLSDTIVDADNNALDGDWTNPARMFVHSTTTIFTDAAISTFPSGNGTAGGDFNFLFTLFPGDANGDLQVNNTDFGIVINHFFATGAWIEGDFNGDGMINNDDFGTVINNFFENLLVPIEFLADVDGENDGVDTEDLAFWEDYELTQDDRGDFNGDGEIDTDDLALLENQLDLYFETVG